MTTDAQISVMGRIGQSEIVREPRQTEAPIRVRKKAIQVPAVRRLTAVPDRACSGPRIWLPATKHRRVLIVAPALLLLPL